MESGTWISGCVVVRILDKAGRVRHRPPQGYSPLRRALCRTPAGRCLKKLPVSFGAAPRPELLMEQRFYHVVTGGWSCLICDALANVKQYIQVGTGGEESYASVYGTRLRCTAPTGMRRVDTGYPDWRWGKDPEMQSDTVIYTATFPAGSLKTKTVNEVCLCAGDDPESECLAYGRLMPGVSLRRGDTLQIQLELTSTVTVEMNDERSL